MRWLVQWIKDDWERNKQGIRDIKKDFTEIKNITKEEFSDIDFKEIRREARKDLSEIKSDIKKLPDNIKQLRHEEREKQRMKDAERNPGPFSRVFHAAMCAMLIIGAIALIPTIIGIPIAALMFGFAVYLWRGWVTKKPEEYVPKEFDENK